MHSFQPSRGRVLFEVVLVLGVAASLAGAWTQTGASALLGAAGVATLYGLVHLFDMRRPDSTHVAAPQIIEFDAELEPNISADQPHAVRPSADDQPPSAGTSKPAPETKTERKPKAPRKSGARRSKTAKMAMLEAVPSEGGDVPRLVAPEDEQPTQIAVPAENDFAFEAEAEPAHPHIEPLFEPEPFVRMPRRAFGRRGRI